MIPYTFFKFSCVVFDLFVFKAIQANSSQGFLGEKSGPLRLVCLTSPLSRDDDWLQRKIKLKVA